MRGPRETTDVSVELQQNCAGSCTGHYLSVKVQVLGPTEGARKVQTMKLIRLLRVVLFGRFAGAAAIGGNIGKWQETNPNCGYDQDNP